MDQPWKGKIKIISEKSLSYDELTKYAKLDVRINGVTIDFAFLSILADPEKQLTSQHIVFFQNLLQKYFEEEIKVCAVFDIYFFAEFIPATTKQISEKFIQQDINQFQNGQGMNQQSVEPYLPIQAKQQDQKIYKPTEAPKNPELKKFKFEVKMIEVVKQEEGEYKINKMQVNLDKYNQVNNLSLHINPIYQHSFSFFPINLQNMHWISLIIDLKNETILYQDSAFSKINEKITKGMIKILDYKKPRSIEWKLISRTPQQKQSQDCGVFILYSLFFLYRYKRIISVNDFDQFKARKVRQNLVKLTIAEFEQQQQFKSPITKNDVIKIIENNEMN